MYETFLSTVPLLSGLNTWEKAKIADALETEIFDRGEVVIHQGDVGEYFYLVESGEAEVIIEGRGGVKQYTRGDYFGGTLSVPLLRLEFIWRGWGLWSAIVEGYAFLTCSFGSWSPACSFL